MNNTRLIGLLELTALAAIKKQRKDGSFLPGNNGPYFDEETPVRNTSHWLYLFSYLYGKTGNKKYKNAADKAVDYLISKKARPANASFFMRKNPQKDFCNGLIGQAWVIEGLTKASFELEREDGYDLAEKVFFLHYFDKKRAIWRKLKVDGSIANFDKTFNHQLWFAAAATMLYKTEVSQERALHFLNEALPRMDIYKKGLIMHNSSVGKTAYSSKKPIFVTGKEKAKKICKLYVKGKSNYLKSVGYHSFNLYALAILKNQFPQHPFFQSEKFKKMISYIYSSEYKKLLESNKYGYPFNITGIEIAFVIQEFEKGKENLQKEWIKEQFKRHYSRKDNLMNASTNDPETLSARIYEAARLKEVLSYYPL